jgi:endonuclease/exonuclease/phosphatase (EEP) superfamily protein YafD
MDSALRRATALVAVLIGLLAAANARAKPPAPLKGSFSLLTYNVAGLPEGLSSSRPSVNMPLIGKLLNRYDLALVQEDFAYGRELRTAIAHQYATPAFMRVDRATLGDGLSQFSKTPFMGLLRETWRDCNGIFGAFFDCLAPKGFTFARHLLARGTSVDVYNVHLDAGYSGADERTRKSQLAQLWEAIDRLSRGRAVIVAGDTNLEPSESAVFNAFLAKAKLVDVCQKLGCAEPWRIDRVMFRSTAAVRLTARSWRTDQTFTDHAGAPLSDHLPVSVDFDWSSTPVWNQALIEAARNRRVATLRSPQVDAPDTGR